MAEPAALTHPADERPSEERRDRAALVAAVAMLPHFQGVRAVVGELRPRSWVVEDARGRWWSVWDNGGEAGVELVNSGEVARFAPLTWHSTTLNAATVAYRVAAMMRGEDVDWDYRLDDDADRALRGGEGS